MKKLAMLFLMFGAAFLHAKSPKLYELKCERGFLYTGKHLKPRNIISAKTKGIPDGTRLALDLYVIGYDVSWFGSRRSIGRVASMPIYVEDGVASQEIDISYIPSTDTTPKEVKAYFIIRYDSTRNYYDDEKEYEKYLRKEELDTMVYCEAKSPEYNVYDKYVFKIGDFLTFPLYGWTFELTNGVETIKKVYEKNPDETLVFDKVAPGNWRLKMSHDQSALENYLEEDIPKTLKLDEFYDPFASRFWVIADEMKQFGVGCMRNDMNWVLVNPYIDDRESIYRIYGEYLKDEE